MRVFIFEWSGSWSGSSASGGVVWRYFRVWRVRGCRWRETGDGRGETSEYCRVLVVLEGVDRLRGGVI